MKSTLYLTVIIGFFLFFLAACGQQQQVPTITPIQLTESPYPVNPTQPRPTISAYPYPQPQPIVPAYPYPQPQPIVPAYPYLPPQPTMPLSPYPETVEEGSPEAQAEPTTGPNDDANGVSLEPDTATNTES